MAIPDQKTRRRSTAEWWRAQELALRFTNQLEPSDSLDVVCEAICRFAAGVFLSQPETCHARMHALDYGIHQAVAQGLDDSTPVAEA